jgi:hypothetical protein
MIAKVADSMLIDVFEFCRGTQLTLRRWGIGQLEMQVTASRGDSFCYVAIVKEMLASHTLLNFRKLSWTIRL